MNKTQITGLLGLGTAILAACGSGSTGADGNSGLVSLLATNAEPAGENCPNGGQRLTYGADDNRNGKLDASEIEGTQYVCDGGGIGATGPDGANGADGPDGATGAK